jgi:hypothetical protein
VGGEPEYQGRKKAKRRAIIAESLLRIAIWNHDKKAMKNQNAQHEKRRMKLFRVVQN